ERRDRRHRSDQRYHSGSACPAGAGLDRRARFPPRHQRAEPLWTRSAVQLFEQARHLPISPTMSQPADPVTIARDLVRCRSVTPAEGGALGCIEKLLGGAGFAVERVTFAEPGA